MASEPESHRPPLPLAQERDHSADLLRIAVLPHAAPQILGSEHATLMASRRRPPIEPQRVGLLGRYCLVTRACALIGTVGVAEGSTALHHRHGDRVGPPSLRGHDRGLWSAQIFVSARQPFEAAIDRAWGAALTLIVLVFVLTFVARLVARRFTVR